MKTALDLAFGLLVIGGTFLGILGTILFILGELDFYGWWGFVSIPGLLLFGVMWYAGVTGAHDDDRE